MFCAICANAQIGEAPPSKPMPANQRVFVEAIANNDLNQIRRSLKKQPKLLNQVVPGTDYDDWMDVPPIDIAAAISSYEVFKFLVDEKAEVSKSDLSTAMWILEQIVYVSSLPSKTRPLVEPTADIRARQFKKMKYLLEKHPEEAKKPAYDDRGTTIFQEACAADWIEMAEYLRTHGTPIVSQDKYRMSALFSATSRACVDYLRTLGCDPNQEIRSKYQWGTPLTAAVQRSWQNAYHPERVFDIHYAEAVESLIRAGAKTNCVDSRGYTPLGYVASFEPTYKARILIKAGTDPNEPSPTTGLIPINLAIPKLGDWTKPPAMIEVLLELGADPKRVNANGDPPVLAIVKQWIAEYRGPSTGIHLDWNDYLPVIKVLVAHGASVNAPNLRTKETPIELLEKRGYKDDVADLTALIN